MGCRFSKPKEPPAPTSTPIYRFNKSLEITHEHVEAWEILFGKKFRYPDISHSNFDHTVKSKPIDIPCASQKRNTRIVSSIIAPVSPTLGGSQQD
jgi:hypothetical protein